MALKGERIVLDVNYWITTDPLLTPCFPTSAMDYTALPLGWLIFKQALIPFTNKKNTKLSRPLGDLGEQASNAIRTTNTNKSGRVEAIHGYHNRFQQSRLPALQVIPHTPPSCRRQLTSSSWLEACYRHEISCSVKKMDDLRGFGFGLSMLGANRGCARPRPAATSVVRDAGSLNSGGYAVFNRLPALQRSGRVAQLSLCRFCVSAWKN